VSDILNEPENVLENRQASPDFSHVDTWIFDLDNTLYPSRCNLFAQVDQRMSAFIADYLRVDPVEARRIQKLYYVEHGTTLNGLMKEHGMKPEAFLDYVHDIDVSMLEANKRLSKAIDRLKGRKLVLTNGSRGHALNVTGQLGLTDHFDEFYGIEALGYAPKPHAAAYDRFLELSGTEPLRAAMFEDIARNLEVPHTLGMTTVWVRPPLHPDAARHEKLAHEGADGPHVHHVTDTLEDFLETL
jgi:putative hydrolase of the HAD superfamily